MLNLPRWQVIGIIAITALAALFALPNLLPGSVLDKLPTWYQQSRINLGLDLRGGAYFLLEADLRGVLNERLANLSDSVRGGKESDEDDKPMLPAKAAAPAERKSLLGSLFGGKK